VPLFLCCAGIVADNGAINAAYFLPYPSERSEGKSGEYFLATGAQGPNAGKDGTEFWK